MDNNFTNVYDDEARAQSYDALDFPGTYFLAYRDLPEIIARHVRRGAPPHQKAAALDFGCGTGRSSRFLRGLGFRVTGVDIAAPMLARARQRDPSGDYRQVRDGDLAGLDAGPFDLVLSAFTFDNIPMRERKAVLFRQLARLLKPNGRIVNLVSSPEIYTHEWASFSTIEYPGNHAAKCGERVRIVMLDVGDHRPVEDVLWTDEGYRDIYRDIGLTVLETAKPLGKPDEPIPWVSELKVAPWTIYVLGRE